MLAYCGPEENQNGAFLEIGSALGWGPNKTGAVTWREHWKTCIDESVAERTSDRQPCAALSPNVRHFDSLEQAVQAIMAMQAGQRARVRAVSA